MGKDEVRKRGHRELRGGRGRTLTALLKVALAKKGLGQRAHAFRVRQSPGRL